VARLHRGVEALAEHAQRQPARRRHQHAAGQPDGVDDRAGEPRAAPPAQRGVEEGGVETGVVRHEHRVAGELQEGVEGRPDRAAAAQVARLDAGQAADRARQRHAGIDQPLERAVQLQRLDAHGADLDDAVARRPRAGRLQVDDAVDRLLQRQPRLRPGRQGDVVGRAPREPRVGAHDLVDQRAGDRDGHPRGTHQQARGLGQRHRLVPLLEQTDEAVRPVQRKLEPSHANIRSHRRAPAATWSAPVARAVQRAGRAAPRFPEGLGEGASSCSSRPP
jgi:hypothetical protein